MTSDEVREAKRQWLELLLRERLAADLVLQTSKDGWTLHLPGDDGVVSVSAVATDLTKSAPACGTWDATGSGLDVPLRSSLPTPGCAAAPQPLVDRSDSGWVLRYDVLELAFWMLTRQEELGRTDLDERGRFPASSSHAQRYAYLERPIVDEWMVVLRQLVARQWPGAQLRRHQFATVVSHDADNPSRYAFGGLAPFARMLALDVVRRRDAKAAIKGVMLRARSRKDLQSDDPANTFDWIMDRSEERGLASAFYFTCGRTEQKLDAYYDPEDPRIRSLMRQIHARGHEIGLHPSYHTYLDSAALRAEFERLKRVCDGEGIAQKVWGGRMHFLRWDTAVTLRAWDDAGLDYDNTLTYADAPGFRCGTSLEYPAFDPVANAPLRLRIRPLVVMEGTVMADRYLGLGDGDDAFAKFADLKNACRSVGGTFTLLWHNSYLETDRLKDLYCRVLDA